MAHSLRFPASSYRISVYMDWVVEGAEGTRRLDRARRLVADTGRVAVPTARACGLAGAIPTKRVQSPLPALWLDTAVAVLAPLNRPLPVRQAARVTVEPIKLGMEDAMPTPRALGWMDRLESAFTAPARPAGVTALTGRLSLASPILANGRKSPVPGTHFLRCNPKRVRSAEGMLSTQRWHR